MPVIPATQKAEAEDQEFKDTPGKVKEAISNTKI
jgi:hypothetical protein